jgi:5-methyltetrahydropteroyltriglutamate--homocysteine methyltransferase
MRDIVRYPSFLQLRLPDFAKTMVSLMNAPKAIGPVAYTDRSHVDAECDLFERVTEAQPTRFRERFMTAASPGIVAAAMLNEHYGSHEEYVTAVADALAIEYRTIVDRGFVLQIDAPDLAMERHTSYADRPLAEFLRYVDTNVTALNRALADVDEERVRLHVCWGNYEGPHDDDVPLDEILPRLYAANVGALMISMANPRHAHEHRCFARYPLPAGMLLIAGVIDPTTNYVEHPEVVADRIELVAHAVGDPRRVLAGPDCGFATAAGLGEVAEEVVWEKLRALVAGARLATERLLR